jgi:heptosyltransferase-2
MTVKLVVFCPNWIGDVVMATPTLRAVRKLFPEARITGLMRPYVAETLAGAPWLDETIFYDHKRADVEHRLWAVAKRLRNEEFDLGLLLTNSIRSALIAWLGCVERRVGYARDGRGVLLNDPLPIHRERGGYPPSPLIDYYLAVAYHVGAAPESYQLELYTSAQDRTEADRLWSRFGFTAADRVVAFNPGAAFGGAKRWPCDYFARLAQRLVDEHDVKVLVLCGPNERGFARFIADAGARPRQIKCMAEESVSIGLSKEIVRRASLLVTTDSGPRHFAAAFATPAVSLFGPTHIEWTDTYYSLETKLQKKLDCGPCQQRECPLGHVQCMKDLTVDEVYEAASHWLHAVPKRQLAG